MASFSGITIDTGKDEKDCMFEQTGLGLFIFDENKLIAVGFHLIQVHRLHILLFQLDGLRLGCGYKR